MPNKKNYAASTVATAPSPATTGTTLTVKAGEGAYFPTPPFSVTLAPTGVLTNPASAEKALVTAVNGDVFTLTRAQGGTTAKSVAANWVIANSIFTEDLGGLVAQPTAPADTSVLWYDTDDDSAPAGGGNSHMVDGIHANTTAEAGKLFPLGAGAKYPQSVIPAMELGYAEITSANAAFVGNSTPNDIVGLSVTVTVPSGAAIEIEGYLSQIYSTVDSDRADFSIAEGSTGLAYSFGRTGISASGWGGATVKTRLTPTAGTHTYKLRIARGAGTGTVGYWASSDAKGMITVRLV